MGFYQTVSSDLQEIFPDVRSFSVTNLKYMRYFDELYSNIENRPQLGDDSTIMGNRQQLAGDFGKSEVFCIPWGHHKLLIDKCKGNPEKALFYVRKTI